MVERQTVQFPDQIPVDMDKQTRAVFLSLDETLFVPEGIVESFRKVDDAYTRDRYGRLKFMTDSLFSFGIKGSLGLTVPLEASLEHDERNGRSDEIMLIASPLNDGPPESKAVEMYHYVQNNEADKKEVNEVKPNTWSPAVKLDIGYEFLNTEGVNMPHLQLFSRVPPRALKLRERPKLPLGDFRGYGRAGLEALRQAKTKLKEIYGGDGPSKVHVFGAGTVQYALAMARYLQTEQDEFEAVSLTGQNLIMGEKIGQMLPHYTIRQQTGEAAKYLLPPGYTRIIEPAMRRETDRQAEFAMRLRQIRAIADVSYMLGLSKLGTAHTAQEIEAFMGAGGTATFANAYNGSMTAQTRRHLPVGDGQLHLVDIVGVEGKKVGMITNEHAGALSLVKGIGLQNARQA